MYVNWVAQPRRLEFTTLAPFNLLVRLDACAGLSIKTPEKFADGRASPCLFGKSISIERRETWANP